MIRDLITIISKTFGLQVATARIFVILAAVVAVVSLAITVYSCHNDNVVEKHENKVYKELVEDKIRADEKSDEQRVKDAVRQAEIDQTRKDIINEARVEALPESSRKLGCERLRDDGYATSRIPECSGY